MDAVTVAGVSKRFRLDHERYPTLKERILHLGRAQHEEFWALRDIDLAIEEGTTFGLLGHNGSGKSTLLKCIAGILRPSAGEITTRGRVASLLELGAGFQGDLTGRENVYLNGSILGMSRRDLDRRFDDIVAFSELEQFIDTQVRFYSSGMYVRLGFAVAVHVEPDILLVDEVLSVGDESFQQKCLDRVAGFQRDGRTIVVVTHAADLVRRICQSAAVLDHGLLVGFGDPAEAVRSFREHLHRNVRSGPGAPPPVDDRLRIMNVRFEYPGAAVRTYLHPGEPLDVVVELDADVPVPDPVVTLRIFDQDGRMVHGSSTAAEGVDVGTIEGTGLVTFSYPSMPLMDGTYAVTVCLTSHDGGLIYDWHEQRHHFQVVDPDRAVVPAELPVKVTVGDAKTEVNG